MLKSPFSDGDSMWFWPFEKPLDQLEAGDLKVLRNTPEGWYVEYKRTADSKSIAKSLSAFANTYGGWIFYGVAEREDRDRRCAGGFPGIPVEDLSSMLDRIRDAARNGVAPPPYFEQSVIFGPCEDLGLPDGRVIIALRVPAGANTPYLHSKGQIYRRVSDASDPKPETDRTVLDLLWERRKEARARLQSTLDSVPLLSKGESENTWIHFFLMHDPFGDRKRRSRLRFQDFAAIMRDSKADGMAGVSFDNAFPNNDGYYARQTVGGDSRSFVPTWRYREDATSIVSFPVRIYAFTASHLEGSPFFDGYLHGDAFVHCLRTRKISHGSIVDLNLLFLVILSIVAKHQRLMSTDRIRGDFFAKVFIDGLWRRTPFIDDEEYVLQVGRHGLPLTQDESAWSPSGSTIDSLLPLHTDEEVLEQAGLLFLHVARCFGLPADLIHRISGRLLEIGERARRTHSSIDE